MYFSEPPAMHSQQRSAAGYTRCSQKTFSRTCESSSRCGIVTSEGPCNCPWEAVKTHNLPPTSHQNSIHNPAKCNIHMKSWHHLISNPHRCSFNSVSVNKPAAGWNFINTSNCSQCKRSLYMCGVGTSQKRPPPRRSACRSRAADSPEFWTHRHECGHFRFRQVSSGGSGFQRSPAPGGSFLRGCVWSVYFVSPARPALCTHRRHDTGAWLKPDWPMQCDEGSTQEGDGGQSANVSDNTRNRFYSKSLNYVCFAYIF